MAPPGTASHADDGDDLLDALLGLDVSGVPAATTASGGSGGGGDGFAGLDKGSDAKKTFSAVASVAAGAGGDAGGGAGDDGDSMLDALLGLEVAKPAAVPAAATAEVRTERDSGGGGAASYDSDRHGAPLGVEGEVAFGGDAAGSVRGESTATAEEKRAAAGSKARDRVGGGGGARGGEVVPNPPPFEGTELGRLCTHLNDRNRRAKRLAQRCQEMFLRLFFKVRHMWVIFCLFAVCWCCRLFRGRLLFDASLVLHLYVKHCGNNIMNGTLGDLQSTGVTNKGNNLP